MSYPVKPTDHSHGQDQNFPVPSNQIVPASGGVSSTSSDEEDIPFAEYEEYDIFSERLDYLKAIIGSTKDIANICSYAVSLFSDLPTNCVVSGNQLKEYLENLYSAINRHYCDCRSICYYDSPLKDKCIELILDFSLGVFIKLDEYACISTLLKFYASEDIFIKFVARKGYLSGKQFSDILCACVNIREKIQYCCRKCDDKGFKVYDSSYLNKIICRLLNNFQISYSSEAEKLHCFQVLLAVKYFEQPNDEVKKFLTGQCNVGKKNDSLYVSPAKSTLGTTSLTVCNRNYSTDEASCNDDTISSDDLTLKQKTDYLKAVHSVTDSYRKVMNFANFLFSLPTKGRASAEEFLACLKLLDYLYKWMDCYFKGYGKEEDKEQNIRSVIYCSHDPLNTNDRLKAVKYLSSLGIFMDIIK